MKSMQPIREEKEGWQMRHQTSTQRSMKEEVMLDGPVRVAEESTSILRHAAFRGAMYIWTTGEQVNVYMYMYICRYVDV